MNRLDEMSKNAGVSADEIERNNARFNDGDYLILAGGSRTVFQNCNVRINKFGSLEVISKDGEMVGMATAPFAVYKVKEVAAVNHE